VRVVTFKGLLDVGQSFQVRAVALCWLGWATARAEVNALRNFAFTLGGKEGGVCSATVLEGRQL
jgi:hypothetical protein